MLNIFLKQKLKFYLKLLSIKITPIICSLPATPLTVFFKLHLATQCTDSEQSEIE